MSEQTLDARGLKCPLPVLKARKIMKNLTSGDTLVVLTTDPGAPGDFRHFCEATGHRLIEIAEEEGGHRVHLECHA